VTFAVGWLNRHATEPRPARTGSSQPHPSLRTLHPQETRAFVVHVLAAADQALAERFSEVRPPIRGRFERLEVTGSPGVRSWAEPAPARPAAWPDRRRPATPSWSRA
jgi:hypothetical protein